MSNRRLAFAASFGQERMWFLNHLKPDSALYNLSWLIRLTGSLDVNALRRSLQAVVARHESLRTTFDFVNDSPIQIVAKEAASDLPVIDVSRESSLARDDEIRRWAAADARRPFDLNRGPLMRTTLLRLTDTDHALLFTIHHIVFDGWSMSVLCRELTTLYTAFTAGRPSPLDELTLQYADFAHWQRQSVQSALLESQLSYWKQQLDERPLVSLPTDRRRPEIQTFSGATCSFTVSGELSAALKELSRREGVTLYTTLLAAFQVFLYRYTGQDDILMGSPTANRNRVEMDNVIGYFANTMVLRTRLAGDPSFRELLRRAWMVVAEAQSHQDVPFEKVVATLQPERRLSHAPVFQVMFGFQNDPIAELQLPGLTVSSSPVSTGTAKFDVSLLMEETETGLKGVLEYATDLFDPGTISRMLNHYQTLLAGIAHRPERRISELPLLSKGELDHVLAQWSRPWAERTHASAIHQLFELEAARTPDAMALTFEDRWLTYENLNKRANQLARYLRKLGVGPDVLVGLCVDRSPDMIVGMLGILKAGGAYVPLDPNYPAARLAFLLKDTQAPILLTQQRLVEKLPEFAGHVVCVDTAWSVIAQEREENLAFTPANLAYVIYTSGSTGQPKGVTVTHGNVVSLFAGTRADFNFNERDVWTLFHSYAFDFSVWEIWGALLHGGRLVVVPLDVTRSPDAFNALCRAQQVTVLNQTPSAFRQFMRADEQVDDDKRALALRWIVFGGEFLAPGSLKPWFDRHGNRDGRLVNMYGITETTVHVTYRPLTSEDVEVWSQASPIGRPIPTLELYALDRHLNPVPMGAAGEAYVGGSGLAQGYLARPELTADRFVPNPFTRNPGARLYKTGDRVRYQGDGQFQILGRLDRQVKVRGFRIELGEIEAALVHHPDVREAVVIERSDTVNDRVSSIPSDTRLVAYIVPNLRKSLGADELRQFLKKTLPEHMVPAAFVTLNSLPLTSSGKVDLRALPAPGRVRPHLGEAYVGPRTEVEEILSLIWAEVLGLQQVGVHDNFFSLGGDSIRVIQILDRLKRRDMTLSLQQFFQNQTISELAREVALAKAEPVAIRRIEPFSLISAEDRRKLPDDVEDAYPLTMLQAGMFFHMELTPNANMYHNTGGFHMRTRHPFRAAIFQEAVDRTVARHAVFRTSFDFTNYSRPLQLVHNTASLPVQIEDLRHLPFDAQEEVLAALLESERTQPFDLTKPTLLRFFVHLRSENTFQFTITECHSIYDGWSYHSTIVEIFNYYAARLADEAPPEEPQPAIAFRDFVALEQQIMESADARRYWSQKLSDCTLLRLPRRSPTARQLTGRRVHSLRIPLAPELYEGLQRLTHVASVPLKSALLTAHVKVMSLLSGNQDILTGVGTNGRPEEIHSDKLFGLFLNTVPFRLQLRPGTWIDFVQRTFEAEQEFVPFRRYPLASIQKDWGREPLCDEVLFNYMDFHVYDRLSEAFELQIIGDNHAEGTNFTLVTHFHQRTLIAHLKRDQLLLHLDYDATRLSEEQVRMIGDYYLTALTAMASRPSDRHELLCFLSEAERRHRLVEWNSTDTSYPLDRIERLFEAQAERTPDAVAVVTEHAEITYSELNARANQLAHHLRRVGVRAEVLVGLYVERSLESIVGMLGILKAGGAYLPLDPTYPRTRLMLMLADTQTTVLLARHAHEADFSELPMHVVHLDASQSLIARESRANPANTGVSTDDLAYVMYTSGSSGRPKGISIPHRAISRLVFNTNYVHVQPADRIAHASNPSFDATTFEIWSALLHGARVVVIPNAVALSPQDFAAWIREHSITTLFMTTALFNQFAQHVPSAFRSVRSLLFGGEAVDPHWVRELLRHHPPERLLHVYGPTESTTYASWNLVQDVSSDATTIPIGFPICNTQVYLLDDYLQPVPVGVPGQIHIGGAGLARGYFNQPELTADRFIPHPFSAKAGERLYRTGDIGCYLPDGRIEFQGRRDTQVKIRGHRIELGEIEAALVQHPAIQKAVVVAHEPDRQPDGQALTPRRQLTAYIVTETSGTPSVSELRHFLQRQLPAYMLPAAVVHLDRLPLTANGKIDRRALLASGPARPALETPFVAPRTATEKELADLWAQVLGVDTVGVYDNYFELGGDSIQSIQIVARANQAGLHLTPKQLFERQTIAELAQIAGTANSAHAEQGPVSGPVPLTPIQHWFFEDQSADPHHFNQAQLLQVTSIRSRRALEQAVDALLAHHDALRLRFRRTPSGWTQVNSEEEKQQILCWVDLSQLPAQKQRSALEIAARSAQASLNLEHGPLVGVAYFDLGPEQAGRLLIIVHHLAIDAVSWRILLEDLHTVYLQCSRGKPVQLPPKTTAFQQWAQRLVEHAASAELSPSLVHLTNGAVALPVDHERGPNTAASADLVTAWLPIADTETLLKVLPAHRVHTNEALLTVFAKTVIAWTDQATLLVDVEGHGRVELFADLDLSRTVGWFTTIHPILLNMPQEASPRDALNVVKEQLRQISHHGLDYGVLRYLSPNSDFIKRMASQPASALCFNYVGHVDQALPRAAGFEWAPESYGPLHSPHRRRRYVVEFNAFLTQRRLRMDWNYSRNLHRRTTIEGLAERFVIALRELVADYQSRDAMGYTSVDFGAAELSREDFDTLRVTLKRLAE
jgi:amino acid adenylation domain-containing protein/non-ribosomal peptide synthase protein (TIGR01720 family)